MNVLICVCTRVCRGNGVGEAVAGCFVEPLAGSEPAWRLPLLVPGRHLVLLHSPYLSVPCRPSTFLGGRSAPAFGCRQPRPRGPAQVNAAAPARALTESGRAEQEGACCPLRLALGAAWSAALLPAAAAAPRPAPPRPTRLGLHQGPLTSLLGRALGGGAREGPTGRTLCWPSSVSGFPGLPSPCQMGGDGVP